MSSRLFYEHTTASLAGRVDFDADAFWDEATEEEAAKKNVRPTSPAPRARSRSASRSRTPNGKALPPDYNPSEDRSVMSVRSANSFRRRKARTGRQFDGDGRSVSPATRKRSSTAPRPRSVTPNRYSEGQDTPIRDYGKRSASKPKSSTASTSSTRKGLAPPLKPRTSTPTRTRTSTPTKLRTSTPSRPRASTPTKARSSPTPTRAASRTATGRTTPVNTRPKPPRASPTPPKARSVLTPKPKRSVSTPNSSRSVSTPKPPPKKSMSSSRTPLSSSKKSRTPPLPTRKPASSKGKEKPKVKDADDADLDDLLGDSAVPLGVAASATAAEESLDDILGTPVDSKPEAPEDKPKDVDAPPESKSEVPDKKPENKDRSADVIVPPESQPIAVDEKPKDEDKPADAVAESQPKAADEKPQDEDKPVDVSPPVESQPKAPDEKPKDEDKSADVAASAASESKVLDEKPKDKKKSTVVFAPTESQPKAQDEKPRDEEKSTDVVEQPSEKPSKAPDEKPEDEDKSNKVAAAAAGLGAAAGVAAIAANALSEAEDGEQEIVFDKKAEDSEQEIVFDMEPMEGNLEDKPEAPAADFSSATSDVFFDAAASEAAEESVETAFEDAVPAVQEASKPPAELPETVQVDKPVTNDEEQAESGTTMVIPLGIDLVDLGDGASKEEASAETAPATDTTTPPSPTVGTAPDASVKPEQHPDGASDDKSEKSKKSVAIVDPVSGSTSPEDDDTDTKSKKGGGLLQSILKTEKEASRGTQSKRGKKSTRPVLISCKYNPSRGFSDFQVKKHKKVWQGLVQFEKSKLEAKALAKIIIEELFERDFWPGKHWEIDNARVWENAGSEHLAFNAEKLATWDWKDIYSEASATAVIRFLPDRILIENYAYYVAG